MYGKISAYSKSTGEKQLIPKHWIGHPVLGRDFELTPSAVAAAQQAVVQEVGEPSESWKREDLDKHAHTLGLDTTGLPNKGEVLAAIQAAVAEAENTQDSDDNPSPDETPATGDTEEE